jgi:hypothetical protein
MRPAGEDGFFKEKFHKQLLHGRSFPAAEEINGGLRKRQSRSRTTEMAAIPSIA